MFNFKIAQRDKKSKSRLGILKTPRGVINTPAFTPVGTKGALRGLSFESAKKYGAEIFMVNTFHLFHNDRYKIIEKFGGLHKFLNIKYPIMTDSGGFQIFSLGFGAKHGVGKVANIFPNENIAKNVRLINQNKKTKTNFVKIDEDGATFKLPFDGKILRLTPEDSIKIQQKLGADIIFAFDECTSPLSDYQYTKKAMERTHKWAIRCLSAFCNPRCFENAQVLFGIIQGGEYKDLRKKSAEFIASMPFSGFGIGGSLGKSKKDIKKVLNWTIPYLPENKPRHLLGIGEIDDIFNAIESGIDLFDCVIPTRWARHNTAFTYKGRLNLKSSQNLIDKKPIDQKCKCDICKNYSRAYICHLLREKEIFGIMLLSEHNLAWILNLMTTIRKAIKNNEFNKLKKKLLKHY